MVQVQHLIEALQKHNPTAEVCLHIWNSRKCESKFEVLDAACTNNDLSKFVLIEGKRLVK